jgi:hypothetical protein
MCAQLTCERMRQTEGMHLDVARFAPAIRPYRREWLRSDIAGGLAAGSVVIPQAMAAPVGTPARLLSRRFPPDQRFSQFTTSKSGIVKVLLLSASVPP